MATWTKLVYTGGPLGTPSAGTLSNCTGLPASGGGTGQDGGYTTGDILYASGANTLSKLSAAADGKVLTSTGSGSAPAWESPTGSNQTLTTGTGISGADSGDDGDFTMSITAAQTGISSIYNTGLKVGYASNGSYIDFSTDDQIIFKKDGSTLLTLKAGSLTPESDDSMDLGISTKQFQDGYFDGTLYCDSLDVNGTAVTSTGTELNLLDGSLAQTVTNSKAAIYGSSGELAFTSLVYDGSAITSSAAELNILDGVTATTSELNIMDGVTSTTAELNILDGVTATATEINLLDGVTSTTAELNILDGVTSTASELNILDGVTATAAEINVLDGFNGDVTDLNYAKTLYDTGVTGTEFDYLDGVTSNIQTQLDSKQASGTYYTDAANLTYWTGNSNKDFGNVDNTIACKGSVSIAQNLVVTGDLKVSGSNQITNTTVETVNIEDQQIKLANGASDASDCLVVADRGGANAVTDSGIVSTNGLDAAIFYDASTGHWSVAEVATNFNEQDTTPDVVSANICAVALATVSNAAGNGTLSPVGSIHIDDDDNDAVYVRRS